MLNVYCNTISCYNSNRDAATSTTSLANKVHKKVAEPTDNTEILISCDVDSNNVGKEKIDNQKGINKLKIN